MEDDSFKIEPGAMSYFQGKIEMISGVTMGNVLGKAFLGMATGEKVARPEYKGSGMLVLEPTIKIYDTLKSSFGMGSTSTNGMNMNTSK